MDKLRVLFVCSHNSARSQMAEALLKALAADRFVVESAGLEPGDLNPYVVRAMKEIGIDISGNETKSVFNFFKQGRLYSYVITVCDESQADQCPIFPGTGKKLHWSFPDPSRFEGTDDEIMNQTAVVRDMIKNKIEVWLKNPD